MGVVDQVGDVAEGGTEEEETWEVVDNSFLKPARSLTEVTAARD